MKKVFTMVTLVVALFVFSSATQVKNNPGVSTVSNKVKKKKILVVFSFNHNGCVNTILAVIETNDGSGAGSITQTCPGGGKPNTFYFIIYNATLARQTNSSNFIDFTDEYGNPVAVTLAEKQAIADGVNANWPED